ncbi:MAG: glucokinase [Sandaracinaceae bacterium]|nr:glucokinase [Sandaracinaceae bacterium]
MRILAGDIGGTNTRLALFTGDDVAGMKRAREEVFESHAHASLDEVVKIFLRDEKLDAASFGVAGPVVDNAVRATNLPWCVDATALAAKLALPRVYVLNDFHAIALGIPLLQPSDLHCLNDVAADPQGTVVVIGAGTGLGEAVLVPSQRGPTILSSEGGHSDFAPRNDEEFELLKFMQAIHGRVSVERVVSGPGLASIFDFVVATKRESAMPSTLRRMESEDKGAVIGELALAGADPACARAAHIFLALYGAEAGNLALKVLAPGGLYLAGGIAPRLLPMLHASDFMSSFFAKGRMRRLLEKTRVNVILQTDVGLLGALNFGYLARSNSS